MQVFHTTWGMTSITPRLSKVLFFLSAVLTTNSGKLGIFSRSWKMLELVASSCILML